MLSAGVRSRILLAALIGAGSCTDATRPIASEPKLPPAGSQRFTLRFATTNSTAAPMFLSRCSVILERWHESEWVQAWKPACSFWHWPSEMGGMIRIAPNSSEDVSIEFSASRDKVPVQTSTSGLYRARIFTFPVIPVVRVIYSDKEMIRAQSFLIHKVTLIAR